MLFNQLEETIAFLKTKTDIKPSIGVVLGSGLGALADDVQSLLLFHIRRFLIFLKVQVQWKAIKARLIFGTLVEKM